MSLMDPEFDEPAPRVRRFKHQSYNASVREVHLPSALSQTEFDHDIADNDSHFHGALNLWRQLNLSPAFIRFANQSDSLSASMPLLLHNWREIVDLWTEALDSSDDEALKALLDLLQKLSHDLRTTISPVYPDLLDRLLKLLPRSISAPALTALLATLSALFKYLLIPSDDIELLEATWSSFRETLANCIPEIQTAAAEVWGSAVRRMKVSARERGVVLMAESVEGLEDTTVWMIVFACKSVSQSLHTAATSIIAPLLNYHLSCKIPDATYTLIRRALTAFIHHVKSADQFTALGDMLLDEFSITVKSSECQQEKEQLRRMLEIISIPCSVRSGSRLSQKQLNILASHFPSIPITPSLHTALLKFTAAVLTAGDTSLWLGPGRKVIERSWGSVEFGIKLSGTLAELGWAGWKMIALPSVLKMTPRVLEEEPKKALRMLNSLERGKMLGDVDIVWKSRVEKWVKARLENWERGEETVMELKDILALSKFVPSMADLLIPIIEKTLNTADPISEFEQSFANSAWVLGSCMRTLANRSPDEWEDRVDLLLWSRSAVEKWGWSATVVGGLGELIHARPGDDATIPLEDVLVSLQSSLLSYSRSLRLNTLRFLSSNMVQSLPIQQEVIRRCLQGEEVSIDVQGVRERVLRIGRIGQVVRDGDDLGAGICTRWLIAQLKVNLRPLWSPAAGALATLAQRFGNIVWQLTFNELRAISSHQLGNRPGWMESPSKTEDNENDPWEEERTWRDPSAHKLRGVVVNWLGDDLARLDIVEAQAITDRFDDASYEAQLLAAIGECSSLAEQHNRDLVPFFLTFAGPHAAQKIPRQKLSSWLTLFAKFANPKALHSTDTLHRLYVSLLSHPDRTVQSLSLSCLLTYKSPHLSAHKDQLRILLDNTRWRDELTSLDLGKVEAVDRKEFVDVLIRLLFGLMLEKRGRSRGADRRAAVLTTLAACTDQELALLVDLMLQSDSKRGLTGQNCLTGASEKQQVGFLTLLGDVLRNLGPRLLLYWPSLLGTTVELVAQAHSRIDAAKVTDHVLENEEYLEELEDVNVNEGKGSSLKATRVVRQLGMKRFADFFRCPVSFDFTSYVEKAFEMFISPRVPSVDKENTQAPTVLLELFYAWTLQEDYVLFLVHFDNRVLPKIYDCLIATNAKPAVISRIFDIIDRLLAFSAVNEAISNTVVRPHVSRLLANLALLVERTKDVAAVSNPLSQRQINILSEIAQYSTDANQASTLLTLFLPLLRKPHKLVPEKVKVDLLKIVTNLLPLVPDLSDPAATVHTKTFEMLSQLFQSLRSRSARQGLISAFHCLANLDTSLQFLADLLDPLNAYSIKRLDEPDYDRRLDAFSSLNEKLHVFLPAHHWLPLLYNMLHFIQDPTELAVRNNASFTLRNFVDVVGSAPSSEFEAMFMRTLYPGLKNGLRSRNEMVRAEVLGVIAYAVAKCDCISSLQEMRVLLADGDEEADFFNNIHHIQVHRRTRALRRLADHCDQGHLRSNTLAEIFIPLVGNYVTSPTTLDHHLVNEAISTTGRMAKHLAWGAYYALVQKYLKLSRNKDESERVYVRAVVAILQNFHFPMEEVIHNIDVPDDDDAEGCDGAVPQIKLDPVTSNDVGRIADAVSLRLLPSLLQHLEKRDETDDSIRIPISIGIVEVAKHLPVTARNSQISRLLTALSQILRSKSQETRDLTRDALCRIAISLGPLYLARILREMREALLRGPQLHVLAYVAHALLVHVTSVEHVDAFHTLDDCVYDVAYISAEVIFGQSGKDVQAEEFKTKMREVRASASKGLDAFAIIAKFVSPPKISGLLIPLRAIMQETESVKVMQQVEDVLRRIANGLNSNKHLVPTELLVLCNTLISQNSRFLREAPALMDRKAQTKGDCIVQTKRQLVTERNHYANNSFRFVSFGLDLFNTALRRSRFDFKDSAVMARLEPMVAVVGNTLYSNNAPVLILGLKTAAGMVKCPLKSLDKSVPVFIRQIIDIVKQTGSTESEVVQIAFKSLATILRDCPNAQVKENDLIYLLQLLSPDLEEPARQASVFTMLRAIVARKFVVPEIYDLMDKVSEIMVTNQSPHVQEHCRLVLLQFLLDYPQGKGRLRNSMAFLAKNLSYVHESGRKSVMELLSAIISKFEVGLVREYADLLFVALVMVIANDDSAKCREMAAELIKSLFAKLDTDHRRLIMSHLHSWATQHSQPPLARVSSQVYGLVIDTLQQDTINYIPTMLEDVHAAIARSARDFASVSVTPDEGDQMDIDMEWQVPYHAFIVLSKVLRIFPKFITERDKISWPSITVHLLFPHSWVRTASCRLLGLLYNAAPVAPPSSDLLDDSPLSRVGMRNLADKLCIQLKSEHLDAALSLQVVKNLFYIGKCFCEIPVDAVEEIVYEADDVAGDEGISPKCQNPLPWLFSKLSYQARSTHIARRNRAFSPANWSEQASAVLRWFAAMASYMESSRLEAFLVHILSPVYRIIEEDIIRDTQMDELKTTATELQDLIQAKVGTTKFASVYNRIRQSVLGVRRDRRAARAMEATINSEAAAKRKMKRNSLKKESRKRKNNIFDNKGQTKRRRVEY